MLDERSNGQKRWWIITPVLTIAGMIFGAGGMAYTTSAGLDKHERCIEVLTAKATETEVAQARIDERLKAIDASLKRIETKLEPARKGE